MKTSCRTYGVDFVRGAYTRIELRNEANRRGGPADEAAARSQDHDERCKSGQMTQDSETTVGSAAASLYPLSTVNRMS